MDTNNQPKSKKGIISIIIIIVIIALIAFAMPSKAPVEDGMTTTDTTSDTTTTGSTTTGSTTSTGKGGVTTTATLSRKEALDLYQNRIIRITDQCMAEKVTETLLLKKGEKMMLDNDGTKSHTVVFAGTTYTIGAQGYRTVTLPNDGTVSRTCDTKTGVTTIVVAAPAQ